MSDAITNTVRFVLDGEVIEPGDIDPTRTVLQFLREDLGRTGTKEGCAEGDCGACTVVVAGEGGDGRLRARAINACIQFLPTLDGRELVTVESLRGADGALHPVQRAMVDSHGSQCGFCTPGFVMSLFALYKNAAAPGRIDIDHALAGNLCRCTGYRPIVDAARAMYGLAPPGDDDWTLAPSGRAAGGDEQRRLGLLRSLRHGRMVALEYDNRRYFAPRSAAELAQVFGDYPDATLLAGGTDVGLWVTKDHRDLETVIYTGSVAELNEMSVGDTEIHIGAAVSWTDAMPLLVRYLPGLEEVLLRFASPPIRNAGTLGGNVANGSPIGDSMPALLAAGARLRLRRAGGSRDLPLADFYLGYRQNALQPGEFVEQVLVPLPADGERLLSYKVSKRFDQDISAVCGAFNLQASDGVIRMARVAYGGLAAIPKRACACEAALAGQPFSRETFERAMAALDDDFEPITDMRASDEYRFRIAKNLLLRCYHEYDAVNDGQVPVRIYDYGRRQQA
ncbi:MAG: xanthine dehydrogenase small subunit [Woeseiaceae bacterium]|nr:xanthine dehydrogenase small subunit [Woeseiaceae bacterium]